MSLGNKFVWGAENTTIFKSIFITPEEAKYLMDEFFSNERKYFKESYTSKRSRYKIERYKKVYKSGEWDPLSEKHLIAKSVIIFFKDDSYQSFYEGKHRMIALSECVGKVVKIPFVCAIGWPGTIKKFRSTDSKCVNFQRKFIENNVINKIKSMGSCEIDKISLDVLYK